MGNKQANTTDDGKAMNVIEVQPKSPGAKCGLQPFHDFIISINGNDFRTMNSQQIKEFVDVSARQKITFNDKLLKSPFSFHFHPSLHVISNLRVPKVKLCI